MTCFQHGTKLSPRGDFLRCFLCSELYKDPLMLPCLHSFCKTCIVQQQSSKKTTKCPRCLKSYVMDPEEVPRNVYLSNRVDFYKTQSTNLKNPVCSFCKLKTEINKPAIVQCVTCLDLLCEDCSGKHTETSWTINHQVVSLTEIKTGKHDDAMFGVKYKAYCPKHSYEELWCYCKTCNALACSLCITINHKQHDLTRWDDKIEEKKTATKKICQLLKTQFSTLSQNRDSMIFTRNKLKTLEEEKKSEITKKCSDARSKILEDKNKLLKDLNDHLKPKSQILTKEIAMISAQCRNIEDAVQFAENICKTPKGNTSFLFDQIQERLVVLAEDDQIRNPWAHFSKDIPKIDVKITKPELEIIFNTAESTETHRHKPDKEVLSVENSSDFFNVSDKAVQTSEEDFEKTIVNQDLKNPKYNISVMASLSLKSDADKCQPSFTSVAWINEAQFVVVDANNATIKICSLPLGKILKSVDILKPLAVSAWKDGISCLTEENILMIFSHDLQLRNTILDVSSLCTSIPNSNKISWIENTTIVTQETDLVSKLYLRWFPTNIRYDFFRSGCCLPDGSYAFSDKSKRCLHLVDSYGFVYKTLNDTYGSVAFDKYCNLFIADFQNRSLRIFNSKGIHLTDLHLSDRPRGISILNDKLIIAFEFGSEVIVYNLHTND